MKVALVHDYFFQAGGAERVMEVLHEMFPSAPIFTTVVDRKTLWPRLRDADFRTSWLQPLANSGIPPRALLPFYPSAIEQMDLSAYDLVVSNSSAFAKSAMVSDHTCHVCYCHTPMRFAWTERAYAERERFGSFTRLALRPILSLMRKWDHNTRLRPYAYLANSSAVAKRIHNTYGVASKVVHPPVDVARCRSNDKREDYYLIVSRLAPYKRIDIAVRAFNLLRKRLVVIGNGPDMESLKSIAGPTVSLLGRLPDSEVSEYYASARGFILPGEEDFGITPLEANASGCPVIAFKAGGALDTVVDGVTGLHFDTPTPLSLAEAVLRSEYIKWDASALRAHAEKFGEGPFKVTMQNAINDALERFAQVRARAQTPLRSRTEALVSDGYVSA